MFLPRSACRQGRLPSLPRGRLFQRFAGELRLLQLITRLNRESHEADVSNETSASRRLLALKLPMGWHFACNRSASRPTFASGRRIAAAAQVTRRARTGFQSGSNPYHHRFHRECRVSSPLHGRLMERIPDSKGNLMIRAILICSSLVACAGTGLAAEDALAEVNAARARRGLPAFIYDENLTRAAAGCADFRAARLIAGHTVNDFAALPSGTIARASGCAALEPSWGWGSCCTYERYTYAGAAIAVGRDGKRYMHLFVR